MEMPRQTLVSTTERPFKGLWGTGERGHFSISGVQGNIGLKIWGTGNIGNQDFNFENLGNKATYFKGTREHIPPWKYHNLSTILKQVYAEVNS